ncbi:hypothetical protein GV829_06610 [Sphingomonas lacunae]|uniref:Uncharacterized protein n=1 Tax=Sphingomonas lacunae TaxID=2698828 RepID=A0A6M4ATV9_9SPHN|nr:hypothetical protein [Sphingomonas lacunae]QJQ32166.1 hypothetical protein GV829_06610 [Sphingomonas lacunae]
MQTDTGRALSALPTGLSPDAAARPGAMARLILRRVGITPLLSLLAGSLLVILPAHPASGQTMAAHALARVVVLPHAVRLQRGQVTIMRQGQPATITPPELSLPVARPCLIDRDQLVNGSCRMVIVDLP